MERPTYMLKHQDIILFDGVCHLCCGWVMFVIQRDPSARFKFVSVQSPIGQDILRYLNLPTDVYDTMVYIQNGHVYYRSTAFLHIVPAFGWIWRGLAWFALFVPRSLRDWLYDRVAKNRYCWFGKRETCLIPTPEIESRFL